MRRLVVAALLAASAVATTSVEAATVGDALDRPAVATRAAAQAVLLGAAQSGERLVAVGERGIVVLSDDQGRSWQQAPVPVSVTLTAVRFTGAQGIAVGHGGTVLTSDDAGATWTKRLDGRQAAQLAVKAAQDSGDASALKIAQQFVTDGPDKPFLDVLAFDAQRALVVGAYGLAFATQDGGRTWAPWIARLGNPKGLHLYAVRARGERLVIAGEQGLLLSSEDGGRSFARIATPYKGSFFTLELPADGEIVVAGLRGNVWRSTDAGAHWSQLALPMPASVTGSALRPDGSLLLVNQAGLVLAGRDGAIAALKAPPLPPLNALLVKRDGALLALGIHGAVSLPSALPAGGHAVISSSPTAPLASGRLADFDTRSGSWIERLLFNHRQVVVVLCALVTLLLGWQATRLQLNASFEKTIPAQHPYIKNLLAHQRDLAGLGNAVRIAVANDKDGATIYDQAYLETLRRFSDEVFLLPGVDRAQMKSLWTPTTRWVGVTEDGLEGGPVIPDGYDGSADSLQRLATNVARSGEVGQLVALDAKSSVIYVPLLAKDGEGRTLDYGAFAQKLEALRARYQAEGVSVHITGFAKLTGDLIDGVRTVLAFFALAVAIAAAMVFWYTRCWRSTALVVAASLVAVVWQLGMLPLMGFVLDPYSILVPFLVFAIGMSHGAQKMNGIMQDVGRGLRSMGRPEDADPSAQREGSIPLKLVAARFTFRRLFLAGLTALLADAVGFAVLLVIDIQVIRELAIAASLGVAVLIFTNLILLPILLSYTGVSEAAARRSLRSENTEAGGGGKQALWAFLDRFTQRGWAAAAVVVAAMLGAGGYAASTHLKIGDLDPGAPELRPDSRYNRDVAFMGQAYGASSDVLAVMVQTPEGKCSDYQTLNKVDALEWQLRQLEGVESTNTLSLLNRRVLSGLNEGNPKWYEFLPNQDMLNTVTAGAPRGLYNDSCGLLTLYVYLRDHRADTLTRVVDHVEAFAKDNDTADTKFLLAAGSAGIEAATNIVVKQAWRQMLVLVYAAVIVLCFITFRSWRAVVVAVLPLMLTSVLAEALMVALGMGVKVATLPVIALGVGIGVDYALYILSVTLARLREGMSLSRAYYSALLFTGKVVMLTGITLAVGVVTWSFSPIKFQADMGLLLAFMFIWNMLGALVLLPALAHFLLRPAAAQPVAAKDVVAGEASPAQPGAPLKVTA